jgi:F0F1-type ATP synthase membrane subunit c/vacuolar-type H+-ATPase subunit K
MAAKAAACGGSLQQGGAATVTALAAAAAAGDIADAVVRVVARQPALAGMAKQSMVV